MHTNVYLYREQSKDNHFELDLMMESMLDHAKSIPE